MTHELAKQFWRIYIGMANKGGADTNMTNPAVDFTAKAKNGDYDDLSDEDYAEKLEEVESISSFWEDCSSEKAGNILLNALAKTNLSEIEMDEIACILAEASRKHSSIQ